MRERTRPVSEDSLVAKRANIAVLPSAKSGNMFTGQLDGAAQRFVKIHCLLVAFG
jgi:hypothetical protein